MAYGDLTNILCARVAAAKKYPSFSAATDPPKAQVVAWINEGARVIVDRLMPKRVSEGVWTPGLFNKLLPIFSYEEKTGGATVSGLAEIDFPTTAPAVCFYPLVKVGRKTDVTYTVVPVAAREAAQTELQERAVSYVPPITSPIYAFGNGKIKSLPSTSNCAHYFYLKALPVMTDDVSENWPLDDDLWTLAVLYAIARMFCRPGTTNASEAALGEAVDQFFEAQMRLLVGIQQDIMVEK